MGIHTKDAGKEKKVLMQVVCMLMVCLSLVFGMTLEANAARSTSTSLMPPAALAAAPAQKRVNLSWSYSDVSGISGFAVERSNNAASGFAQVGTTTNATLAYSDQGLADAQTYYYRTRAYQQKGKNVSYSAYSPTVSATTVSSQPIPVPQPGAFEFDVSTYRVGESAGRVDITIMRVGGSDGVATVDWRTQGVTATYGSDYGDFNWTTLTFAAGEAVKTQSVTIVNDTAVEGDESFNVLLGNPTGGATLGSVATAGVTIQDDDAAPVPVPGSFEFAVSGYSVSEGAGSVNITIKRVGGSDGVATVDWRTQGVTATFAADYGDFNWTTLTFAAGETSKTQSIAIVNDTAVEGDESFNVLLGNPTGGATLGSVATAGVTIQDDDAAPVPVPGSFEFAMSGYSVSEGAGSVNITIKRVGGSDGVATVDWKTQGVTATFAADYGNFDWTTLTFAAGETSKTQSIAIVNDTTVEGSESFNVLLGNPTGGATLGAITTAAVTIKDDDTAAAPVPGSFEFAVSSYSVNEGAGSVSITIKRVGGSDGVATVDWKTQGVTATFAADYGDFDWTTLTFASGETSKTQNVAILDDTLVEGNESFNVLLGNPTGGATLGSKTTAAVTIADDDQNSTPPTTTPLPTPPAVGYLPVFPGAQGFGTDTPAGRGGKVYKVTNLNDSGAGSLREAIMASGARIVVFEVSGNIALATNLTIRNPYITIAGQTAPSPGITLKGAGIEVKTHDVLVQHLRIRVGDGSTGPAPLDRDGFVVYGPGAYNVVLDHASVSWSIDKGTSNWGDGVNDMTVSNTIVSEALYNSINPQGAHSMGTLVGDHGKNVSFVGNLWAHNRDRNPAMKGDTSTVIMNNVMYDAGAWAFMYMADDFNAGPSKASIAGNVFIEGPSSDTTIGLVVQADVKSGTQIYLSDNIYQGTNSFFKNSAGSDPRVSSAPVWHQSLAAAKSSIVEANVLARAGARPADRDSVDDRVVNEVKSRTGNIIDSQQQVGGWPNLAKNTRTFVVPSNPNGDDDGDGYTNIEEVLHQMAAQVEGR